MREPERAQSKVDVVNPRKGKNIQLLGMGVLFIGMAMWLGGCSLFTADRESGFGVAAIMIGLFTMAFGFATVVVGRFVNWYHWK